jgi:hypothetical protein
VIEQLVGNPRGNLGAEAARQLIFVRDDDAVRLLDRVGDAVPVERRDGPEIDDHHAVPVLFRLLRREE